MDARLNPDPEMHLRQLLDRAAAERPAHPAVVDEQGRSWTYAELAHAAGRLATRLARWGVGRGDRVGVFLPKGFEAVAGLHGILRAGAAYVPVDPAAPVLRGAGILADAGVKVVLVLEEFAAELRDRWPATGVPPRFVVVHGDDGGPHASACGSAKVRGPLDVRWEMVLADPAPAPLIPTGSADDLAYILYTSGSTGKPKGVMLSHRNAFAFLDWCGGAFGLTPDDRFASHAPFHFDLSVFDLFASCRLGATLELIGEATGKDPVRLASFLRSRRVDVWYSAPSILAMLAEAGRLDASSAPRLVLFAGEVFPIAGLRKLRAAWPSSRLWNLYGPTETNVCTAQAIPAEIPADVDAPFPIGAACSGNAARVVDEHGRPVAPGAVGELIVNGPSVMLGYFGRPDLTAKAFFLDDHGAWYRTGDLVADLGEGVYRFHGRRDRMVKKRGYRIELGEVEAALYRHEGVDRAAAIARATPDGVSIVAFVAPKPGTKGSIIALKRHCTRHLPAYMVPDEVQFLSNLPTTSTDKVDYQGLKRLAPLASG